MIKCADAGAEMVRITVQGMQEAKACKVIKETLMAKGYTTPLIADIHFAPKVAMMVAECFDKIRVNPGNFADGRKTFEEKLYETDEEYKRGARDDRGDVHAARAEVQGARRRDADRHQPRVSLRARRCRDTATRPAGMVESAFEFARICRKHDYHNFVFSMKASTRW